MTIATRTSPVELSSLQLHLVEHSFEWLTENYTDFSQKLRKRLISHHPSFVDMFEHLPTSHFQFLAMTSVTLLLHSLQNPEHLRVIVQLLYDQKYPPVKQRELYNAFYDSFMHVMSQLAEDAWSPALKGAWESTLDLTRNRIFPSLDESIPTTQQNSPIKLATRRIHNWALIVDDNAHTRKTLITYLKARGYGCYEAENGMMALHYLKGTLAIDIVVSDYHLPVMNGLQFLQTLGDSSSHHYPPVVLYSHNLSRDLVDGARAVGVWAVVGEPYSYEELHTTMVQAIHAHASRRTHRSHKENQ
ncbi:response regulator [Candidatus Nitrospira salsa]